MPDEREDERDRLVDEAEAAHEQVDEREQGRRGPSSANAFAVQITTASRVTRERGRDRVDGEGDVGDARSRRPQAGAACRTRRPLLAARTAGARGTRR